MKITVLLSSLRAPRTREIHIYEFTLEQWEISIRRFVNNLALRMVRCLKNLETKNIEIYRIFKKSSLPTMTSASLDRLGVA